MIEDHSADQRDTEQDRSTRSSGRTYTANYSTIE